MPSQKQSVKIEGLRELDAALKELPKAAAKRVIRNTLKKAAAPVADAAQATVRSPHGGLRHSIVVGTKLTKRQRAKHRREFGLRTVMTPQGWRSEGAKTIFVFVGPFPYKSARLMEFGSSHQPARAYMRPAWDGNEHRALSIITSEMRSQIAKTAARLAAKAAKLAAKAAI